MLLVVFNSLAYLLRPIEYLNEPNRSRCSQSWRIKKKKKQNHFFFLLCISPTFLRAHTCLCFGRVFRAMVQSYVYAIYMFRILDVNNWVIVWTCAVSGTFFFCFCWFFALVRMVVWNFYVCSCMWKCFLVCKRVYFGSIYIWIVVILILVCKWNRGACNEIPLYRLNRLFKLFSVFFCVVAFYQYWEIVRKMWSKWKLIVWSRWKEVSE